MTLEKIEPISLTTRAASRAVFAPPIEREQYFVLSSVAGIFALSSSSNSFDTVCRVCLHT